MTTIIRISRPPTAPETGPDAVVFEGDIENASQREEAHKAIDRAANLID